MVTGWLSNLTDRAMRKDDKIDSVFHPLPGKAVRVAVPAFSLIAVLNRFGVETTSLIALLSAAGLAVGLALQGTLSNASAGLMILIFRPFKVGDAVKLYSEVYVTDSLGFFVCRAHLPDDSSALLPNSIPFPQRDVHIYQQPVATPPAQIKLRRSTAGWRPDQTDLFFWRTPARRAGLLFREALC